MARRRKTSVLGNMAKRAQNNATRNTRKAAYMAIWGEEPPKKSRRKK